MPTMTNGIYLDNASTTPIDPEVLACMTEVMTSAWGNPSAQHPHGVRSRAVLARARHQVLAALGDGGADGSGPARGTVIWTSGCTEADALALFGAAGAGSGAVVLTSLEHPAVEHNARRLEAAGRQVRRVEPGPGGAIDPEAVAAAAVGARVACLVAVQNDAGVTQPVEEAARAIKARAPECHVHLDAAQAFGKVPLDLSRIAADSVAVAAHKLHGPAGIGALWLRDGARLEPLWGGGGQEGGLRSGTQNVPGAAGLGLAAELAERRRDEAVARWRGFALLVTSVLGARGAAPAWRVAEEVRAPHILALGFAKVSAEALRNTLASRGVSVSTGSACAQHTGHGTHVWAALGVPQDVAVVRLSFGWQTQHAEVEQAAVRLAAVVGELSGRSE